MKAIANNQSSMFFNAATSAGPLTSTWAAPFLAKAYRGENAEFTSIRRRLRRHEPESSDWPEIIVRVALACATVGAYAIAIWQIGGF